MQAANLACCSACTQNLSLSCGSITSLQMCTTPVSWDWYEDQESCCLMQAKLQLSSQQIKDLMMLCRVYFLRQDELASERAYLTNKMQAQSQNAFASAAKVSALANKLQQNASADHHTYQRFAWAVYFGVSPLEWLLLICIMLPAPLLGCPIQHVLGAHCVRSNINRLLSRHTSSAAYKAYMHQINAWSPYESALTNLSSAESLT